MCKIIISSWGVPLLSTCTYIQTNMGLCISGLTSFSVLSETLQILCRALPNWLRCLSLGVILIRNKRGLENNNNNNNKKRIKQAPCLLLWSVLVTAWWAISSSPTGAVSCTAGRQPERPPAPRMLAVDAGGPCSTWPHPGMTSTGRGKWTGPGGGGTVSSHRLENIHTSAFLLCKWAFSSGVSMSLFFLLLTQT